MENKLFKLKEEIRNIFNKNSKENKWNNINFYAIIRNKNHEYEIKDINLDKKNKKRIINNINIQLDKFEVQTYAEIPFKPINKTPENIVEVLKREDVNGLNEIIKQFDGENAKNLNDFDYETEEEELWGFITAISLNQKRENGFSKKIISFQKARITDLFTEAKFLKIWKKQGTYEYIEDKKTITIHNKIDCLWSL